MTHPTTEQEGMNQYTPEQVEFAAERMEREGYGGDMLRAYAATLKAAQGGVTEAMVERAWCAYDHAVEVCDAPELSEKLRVAMRAALEAALSAQQGQGEECFAGYLVDGKDFYYPDFPRSEWTKHKSVQPLYTAPLAQPAELAAEYTRGRSDGWEAAKAALSTEPAAQGEAFPMTEQQVRQWIDVCNSASARQVLRDYLRLRTAPPAQPAERVPEGWKLVPVEATDDMLKAAYPLHWWDGPGQRLKQDYRKLVEAASPAPSPAREDGGEG